jgi:hypothetical protein
LPDPGIGLGSALLIISSSHRFGESEIDVGLRKPRKHQMENIQNEETIDSLVNKFNEFGRAAAKQLIERCKAVSRAKAKGKNGFEEFCEKVQIKPASSTIRKYTKISDEADWLLPMADQLPADWTTIYGVALLGQTKAEALISRGILHPQATAKDIKAEAAKIAGVSDDVVPDASTADETISTREPCVLQVDVTDSSDQDRLKLFHALQEIAGEHGLIVTGLPKRLAEQSIIEREAA